ncbi:MAG: glycosyltransferase [Candidatus Aminicenantes bacterium]|nr:glycosyltransferase [Candidatus Aminicenantes bacterium]
MIRACLIVFLASASVLWLSTLGYVLLLEVARFFRRRPRTALPDWPRIAVVVPTLNEEARIGDKIEDLRRTDYPAERVRWVIVDGGSGDRTAAVVGSRIPGIPPKTRLLLSFRASAEIARRAMFAVLETYAGRTDLADDRPSLGGGRGASFGSRPPVSFALRARKEPPRAGTAGRGSAQSGLSRRPA